MLDRSRKRTREIDEIIEAMVDSREQESLPEVLAAVDIGKEKNPAAVALGRLGGMKGGRARAEKLSEKRRKQISRKAALARWRKKDDG